MIEFGATWEIGSITTWGRYPYVVRRVGLPDWEGYADTKDEAMAIIRDLIEERGPAREVHRLPMGRVVT